MKDKTKPTKTSVVETYFGVYGDGTFPRELESLINKHCLENASDTPDFILAEYLKGCLENFDMCVRRREQWYGRETAKPVCTSK